MSRHLLTMDDRVVREQKWNVQRLRKAFDRLVGAIDRKEIPGAVALVGCADQTVATYVGGFAMDREGLQIPMTRDTVFDLASLTKVCTVLPLFLQLLDEGEVSMHDPVAYYLPSYEHGQRSKVTLHHLLTHTSGLPPFRPYHARSGEIDALWQVVLDEPLVAEVNSAVEYSDIGYMTLGKVIEHVLGEPLDTLAARRLFNPLKMNNACYRPAGRGADTMTRFAATEFDEATQRTLVGKVHDENARALGGVSGHAGLFATADDLLSYVQMWLCDGVTKGGDEILSAASVRLATDNHVAHLGGARGLGWCLRTDPYDHMGDLWPLTGFGHTGFTGTSLSLDRLSGLWTILLTNRVHYGRGYSMARLRTTFHNAIVAAKWHR